VPLFGRFSRTDLEALIWSGYTHEEQEVFLGMMESCGICFEERNGESEYIAPELLPKWSGVQELLLGRLRDDPSDATATGRQQRAALGRPDLGLHGLPIT
jgi:internalin A